MALIYSSAVNKRINLRSKRSVCEASRNGKTSNQSQTDEEDGLCARKISVGSNAPNAADENEACTSCTTEACKCASTSHKTSIGSCSSCGNVNNVLERKSQKRSVSKGSTNSSKGPLYRSKTTCEGAPKRKTTIAGVSTPTQTTTTTPSRKVSQPLMTASMYVESNNTVHGKSRERSEMRKALAKKHISQKMRLELDADDGSGGGVEADSPRASESPHGDDLSRCLSLHQSFFVRRRSISVDEGMARKASFNVLNNADSAESSDSVNERKKSTLERMKTRFARWKIST